MFTLEEKINVVLRYIASDDDPSKADFKKAAIEALSEPTPDTSLKNTQFVEDMIRGLFKELGVPHHLIGRDYVLRAIELVMSDRVYINEITKGMYPRIAAEFDTTASRVERAIRHAIEVTFDRGDYDSIIRVFGNTTNGYKGKLTNGEFIAGCAEEIRLRMKRNDTNV